MQSKGKKLHLGCGQVYFPNWLNIDLDTPGADMHLDFTKPLPFADDSVTHIFSEHFIEHITRAESVRFLRECRRVLSMNGVLRITTPNLRFLINSYLANNKDEWGDLWAPGSLCQMMNEGMRSWGHQFIFDAQELVSVFVEAGFNSIAFQKYHHSDDENFSGIESRPFHHELIVEATKNENADQTIDYQALTDNEAQWLDIDNALVRQLKIEQNKVELQNEDIQKIKTELLAHSQEIDILQKTIADQANHIVGLQKTISDQVSHIVGLQQTILDQANHIVGIETVLKKFQNSIYGKLLFGATCFYRHIKRKLT